MSLSLLWQPVAHMFIIRLHDSEYMWLIDLLLCGRWSNSGLGAWEWLVLTREHLSECTACSGAIQTFHQEHRGRLSTELLDRCRFIISRHQRLTGNIFRYLRARLVAWLATRSILWGLRRTSAVLQWRSIPGQNCTHLSINTRVVRAPATLASLVEAGQQPTTATGTTQHFTDWYF